MRVAHGLDAPPLLLEALDLTLIGVDDEAAIQRTHDADAVGFDDRSVDLGAVDDDVAFRQLPVVFGHVGLPFPWRVPSDATPLGTRWCPLLLARVRHEAPGLGPLSDARFREPFCPLEQGCAQLTLAQACPD